MQAICSLHQGTFKGTTPGGVSVSSHRVFGYGEIADLLTYAQFLATHDNATLTSDNPRSYLAEALQRCGTTPLETCLKATVPGTAGSSGNGQGKPSGKSHH